MYGDGQTPQGTDAFQFFLNSGVDRILDFQNDIDQLEVSSAYGFASPAVIATATVSGADVTLHFGGVNERSRRSATDCLRTRARTTSSSSDADALHRLSAAAGSEAASLEG